MNDRTDNQTRSDIGVVIVAYNNLHEDCLKTLAAALSRTRFRTEIVIVDNASDSPTAEELARLHLPQAKVITRDGNCGFARSANHGATHLDSRYVFLLNPDTNLKDPDILDKLADHMESRPDIGLLAPRIYNFDGSRQDTCRRFPAWHQPIIQRTFLKTMPWGKEYIDSFMMSDFDQTYELPVDWVQGSAMFMPTDLFRELGGFDERFWMYFEDVDLCRRVWEADRKVVYAPHITLHHAYGRASARINNPVLNIISSKPTRAHVSSWIKYLWKWKNRPVYRPVA